MKTSFLAALDMGIPCLFRKRYLSRPIRNLSLRPQVLIISLSMRLCSDRRSISSICMWRETTTGYLSGNQGVKRWRRKQLYDKCSSCITEWAMCFKQACHPISFYGHSNIQCKRSPRITFGSETEDCFEVIFKIPFYSVDKGYLVLYRKEIFPLSQLCRKMLGLNTLAKAQVHIDWSNITVLYQFAFVLNVHTFSPVSIIFCKKSRMGHGIVEYLPMDHWAKTQR